MWWLTLKKWWAKTSIWCRQHWRWLVMFAVFIIAYSFGRKNTRSLLVQSKLALKQAEKDLAAVDQAHEKEIEMRNAAREKYNHGMNKLRNEFSKNSSKLEIQKQKEIEKMLKKAKSDPNALDKILEQELGIKKT